LIARSEFFGNADVPVRLLDDARLLLPFGLLTYAPPDTLKLGAALTFTRKPSPTT
jgi:hypothetical protein